MKTNLITPEGYEKLETELDNLWRKERPEVTRIVSWAASLGDRSENADYKYNKQRLREIDRRVRYLRKRLDEVRVVDYNPCQEGKVYFGCWVKSVSGNREHLHFRIVGPDEIYGQSDYVSIDAPIARACIGKSEGDDVFVKTPLSEKTWHILKIWYEKPAGPAGR